MLPPCAAGCAALETLQALRDQISMAKYQQLKKDLEPQDTAGLDVALADTVHTLSQRTQLGAAQVGCTQATCCSWAATAL